MAGGNGMRIEMSQTTQPKDGVEVDVLWFAMYFCMVEMTIEL